MFEDLVEINKRPKPFEFYTASDLWTDEHTSKQMLSYHLDEEIDISSRNKAFIERSVDWLTSRFQIENGMKVIDFGCGPGLYTTRLAKKGAAVTGIDFSKRSVDHASSVAAEEELPIHYIAQNYLEFGTDERYHLVLMIMCDYCALSPEQRSRMLETFRSCLESNGRIVLDVYSLNSFAQREETAVYASNLLNGFWSPHPYYGFLNTFKYEDEKVILDKYTIVESTGTRTIYNWLQHFSPESLEQEFAESGLAIETFLSNVAGEPFHPESNEFAVIARKA